MEQIIDVITGKEYVVLVVTPTIIDNYFSMCKRSSLSDFTLLIFDEYHHAKKEHPYNEIIKKYLEAKAAGDITVPQVSIWCSNQILSYCCWS